MSQNRTYDPGKVAQPTACSAERPPIRGFLIGYVVLFIYLLLHGAALTVASIVIYHHPEAGGLHSSFPLGFLLFYVITNVVLILYGIYALALVALRRRSAIVHNAACNLLSAAFLVAWHFLGEKSNVGTVVDSLPGLVSAAYFLRSKRVRATFISRP